AKCGSENSEWSATQHFTTSAARLADVNAAINLSIYPNPAKDQATIQFTLIQSSPVSINVYDISGRAVKTLRNEDLKPETYSMNFNTTDFAKGIYFVRMISGNGIQNQKLIIQ
ncbi:MAG: T9SS type A sorting domain-containing protein, partial [Chitinophagales bacterium]